MFISMMLAKTRNSRLMLTVTAALSIKFEFTGHDTPQHNHLAELAFALMVAKGHAIMINANVSLPIHNHFRCTR
jgi:hypothetical protein